MLNRFCNSSSRSTVNATSPLQHLQALIYNICFALTDGPYPEPYGLRLAPIRSRLAQASRAPSAPEGKPPIDVYRKLLPFVLNEVWT